MKVIVKLTAGAVLLSDGQASKSYTIIAKTKFGAIDWTFKIPLSDIAKYGFLYEQEMIRHNKKLAKIFYLFVYQPTALEVK